MKYLYNLIGFMAIMMPLTLIMYLFFNKEALSINRFMIIFVAGYFTINMAFAIADHFFPTK